MIDYTFSPSLPPSNIIFFGTACVDKLTYINEFNRNSKIGVEKILKQAGGNSGNAACACRGLINGVGVVTKVGEDEDGVFVVEELNKRNIGTSDVIKSYSGGENQNLNPRVRGGSERRELRKFYTNEER